MENNSHDGGLAGTFFGGQNDKFGLMSIAKLLVARQCE
jgi:hypothetical protein